MATTPTFQLDRFATSLRDLIAKHPDGTPHYVPVRVPHHTVSTVAMTGRTVWVADNATYVTTPGECQLARRGLLVLHDLPEFRLEVAQAIADPFRDRCVSRDRFEARIGRMAAMFRGAAVEAAR